MTDTITCPSCRRTLRVPESLRGQLVKCPTCEETFTAADGAPPPRPTPPPPPRPPAPSDEDEPRPRRARRDDWEDDRDDYDDRPRRREKPGKVQAIAVMTLVGGIMATLL